MGSRTPTWIAVMLVFLISYPKQLDGGPAAFVACATSTLAPVCSALLSAGKSNHLVFLTRKVFVFFCYFL